MRPIKKIAIEQIERSDETFSVNFMPDLRSLRFSIKEVGLIQPVLLKEKRGRYQIVCGFRRVAVMLEFGNLEIESRVLEEEMDDLGLFTLVLHENLTTRGFNNVEKAVVLHKLIHDFQIDHFLMIKTFLPLLDLEPNEKILSTFLSLACMENEVKAYILKEEVSRSNIRRFSEMTSSDRQALLSLISPLKLGENRLRELLTYLEEISQRDGVRVKDIVSRPEIEAILSQRDLTPSQRTERVKKVLFELRYPRMSEMEGRFEQKRRELNLPSAISLYHQPFFEGKGMRIEFQFEALEEYQSLLSFLTLLADKVTFREMLKTGVEQTNAKCQIPNAR